MFRVFFVPFQNAQAAALSFRRFWERILDFFTPDCGEYRHFTVDSGVVGICLFGIFAGILAAMLVSAYEKSLHADLIGTLTDRGADCPEKALTLAELDFAKSRRVRREFTDGTGISRYVCRVIAEAGREAEPIADDGIADTDKPEPSVEEGSADGDYPELNVEKESSDVDNPETGAEDVRVDKPEATQPLPSRLDLETARFYLPDQKRIAAEVRYLPGKNRVAGLVLSVLALAAAYLLMIFLAPELLQLLDNCLGLMSA